MTPALLPHLALKREAYQKGLAAGRRAKTYDDASRDRARGRFTHKYAALGQALLADWLEGWRDAEIYRRWKDSTPVPPGTQEDGPLD